MTFASPTVNINFTTNQSQYPCHCHFHSKNSLFQKLGCRFLPIPSIVVTCFDHIVIFLNLEMVEKFLAHFYSHKMYVVVLYAFVDEYWWIRFFLRNHTPGSNLRSEILQPHSTSCLSTRWKTRSVWENQNYLNSDIGRSSWRHVEVVVDETLIL